MLEFPTGPTSRDCFGVPGCGSLGGEDPGQPASCSSSNSEESLCLPGVETWGHCHKGPLLERQVTLTPCPSSCIEKSRQSHLGLAESFCGTLTVWAGVSRSSRELSGPPQVRGPPRRVDRALTRSLAKTLGQGILVLLVRPLTHLLCPRVMPGWGLELPGAARTF